MGLMSESWASFEKAVMPKNAHPVQRTEMRRAFYAGAQGLLGGLMGLFDPDHEPTEADYKVMEDVGQELTDFQQAVAEERA